MALMYPRSVVVVDGDGLTWLAPDERSTRARHTAGTLALAVLVIVAAGTATLPPLALAVPSTAAVAGVAAWLLVGIVRGAGTRLALSPVGLYLEDGAHTRQIGWAALRGVTTTGRGGRCRMVVDDGHRPVTTRASFETDCVRRWLELAAAEASRRRLEPVAVPDGLGFRV